MNLPTPDQISATASQFAFGERIIQNDVRGLIVEVIVHHALKPDWRHCAGNWNGWDFEHKDSTCKHPMRLEVRQSALQQTWAAPQSIRSPRFDIKMRKIYWKGSIPITLPQPGRLAQMYIFAYHGIEGETADHRNPRQWEFHVVSTSKLPAAGSIGLSAVTAKCPALGWHALFEAVERERLLL